MPDAPLLEVTGVSKSYAGVHALHQVSFDLRRGEVHALIGENGAGKSTLIKLITGAVAADSGSIAIDGAVLERNSPARSRSWGVAAIYQQPALLPDLTVAENIALSVERRGPWSLVPWRRNRDRARALLERIGARIDPESRAGDLSSPEQQLVEIAKAVGAGVRILILDEPTAALAAREVEQLFRVIRELRQGGAGIIYISHRLEELATIADRCTVLRDGRAIYTRAMKDADRETLIRLMVGRELSAEFPRHEAQHGAVALELRNVGSRTAGVRGVSLTVRAGEIVGLAGLIGSGRTELARVLFGLAPADAGEILLRGEKRSIRNPEEAIALGVSYVPEDRRRHGVILEMPVAANCILASLAAVSRNGFLDFGRERVAAAGWVERLRIKTPSVDAPVSALSGGNQQKVSLSRWLMAKPQVLILDEPTQGVDVGAKAEIHRLIGELAGQGMAILLISSELSEVLGMSDRVAVMREGTVVAVLNRADATQERVLALALGAAA